MAKMLSDLRLSDQRRRDRLSAFGLFFFPTSGWRHERQPLSFPGAPTRCAPTGRDLPPVKHRFVPCALSARQCAGLPLPRRLVECFSSALPRLSGLGYRLLRQAGEVLSLPREIFKLLACMRGREFKER
jgi:hypothetical protein